MSTRRSEGCRWRNALISMCAACIVPSTINRSHESARRPMPCASSIAACRDGTLVWVSSDVVDEEARRNPNAETRSAVLALASFALERAGLTDAALVRARQHAASGLRYPCDNRRRVCGLRRACGSGLAGAAPESRGTCKGDGASMNGRVLSDAEVRREALEAIVIRLGPTDALRFLRQLGVGTGDYTAERAGRLDAQTVDEIAASIAQRRKSA